MKMLIKNAQIITSAYEPVLNGSIAVENDEIKYVGEIPECFSADSVIDAHGFIAMPGLVNSHTHSAMGILRNFADDLPFNKWLFDKIIPAEAKLTPEDIYWGCMLGISEMIKSGTTCFNDMYLHMESIARAVADTGIRANLSYGPITSDARGNGFLADYTRCESFIKKHSNSNIKTSMEIHSVYLYEHDLLKEAASFAKSLETKVHIHLAESESEILFCREKYSKTPFEIAYDTGILGVPVIAAHCVKTINSDIEILKKADVTVVHCPSSNMKLGNGFAPIESFLNENMSVGIGTDGSASNNNLNMFEEMHLTAMIHKGYNNNPECIPASAVIEMATEKGAYASGFLNCGKIASGYKADIILINTQTAHMCPLHDAKAAIVYSAQAGDVDTVMINGKIMMKNRKLLTIDEEMIISRVNDIACRIRQ